MNGPGPAVSGIRILGAVCIVLSALAVLWFVWPVFAEPFAWGSTRDWGYFTFLEEVTRKTVLEFGEFPKWNPYYFGGAEHLANPQTTLLSPTTLLVLALGTAPGLKVGILVFAAVGFAGMYRLARLLGCDVVGGCISGLVYGCSGWFAQHVGGGHWGFAAVNLFPAAAFFFLRGLEKPAHFVAALLTCTWVAFHWGVYPLPWLFMLLLVVAVGEGLGRKSLRPLKWYGLLALATIGLSAIRLLPVLKYVLSFPRQSVDVDRLGLDHLVRLFLVQHTERRVVGLRWEWPEYGNYLGWIPFFLLGIGLFVKFPRKVMLWTGVAVFLSLALGHWGLPSPYSILHSLPFFQYLRVPSRYTVVALFFIAPIVGLGWSRLAALAHERWRGGWTAWGVPLAGVALLVGIAADPLRFNRLQFEQSFHLAPPTDLVSPTFEQRRGDPNRMYAYPRANQGSVLGLEESPIPSSPALWINARDQHMLAEPDGATARQVHWSPNRLRFEVETPVDNLLVVNQNHRGAWRAGGGGVVGSHHGLLAVRLPPGKHDVVLTYSPRSFVIGALVSLLTVVLVVSWWARHELLRRRIA